MNNTQQNYQPETEKKRAHLKAWCPCHPLTAQFFHFRSSLVLVEWNLLNCAFCIFVEASWLSEEADHCCICSTVSAELAIVVIDLLLVQQERFVLSSIQCTMKTVPKRRRPPHTWGTSVVLSPAKEVQDRSISKLSLNSPILLHKAHMSATYDFVNVVDTVRHCLKFCCEIANLLFQLLDVFLLFKILKRRNLKNYNKSQEKSTKKCQNKKQTNLSNMNPTHPGFCPLGCVCQLRNCLVQWLVHVFHLHLVIFTQCFKITETNSQPLS